MLNSAPDPDVVRLADLVERYLKRLETYFKLSAVRTHRAVTRNLIRFFRNRPIETWTSADPEVYIQHRLETVAPTSVNGELKNLKATLRFAVEEKLIPEMPFKIRMLPVVQRRTARIFTREEILGHSTIKTTELYAFTNEEAKREASKNALI